MLAVMLMVTGGPGFFERGGVDFWDARKREQVRRGDLWAGSNAPEPVRRLLNAPSAENAEAYVAWQRERLRRMRAALAALSKVSAPKADSILYFARRDCRYCVIQEKELKGLPVTKVPEGSPLWERHGVTVTPTLVVAGRTFRGLTSRRTLLKELNRE